MFHFSSKASSVLKTCVGNASNSHKLSNALYAVQCSEKCSDLYIGETKQLLYWHMAQHRRANSVGQDLVVYLHFKEKGHLFKDTNIHILDREDRWFERVVKKAIYVHICLTHHLSATYNTVLGALPGTFYPMYMWRLTLTTHLKWRKGAPPNVSQTRVSHTGV